MKRLNLVGQRFERLLVIAEDTPHVIPSGHIFRKWFCRCDCGTEKSIFQNSLRSGVVKSCGCYHADMVPCKRGSARGVRIGCNRSDNRYNVWSMMIQRCYEVNHDKYKYYGEQGKTVCDRWLESRGKGFLNFCEDMGERPEGMTLDRINNDLGYQPDNCRWATSETQILNRGKNRNNTSGCRGVTFNKNANMWSATIGHNYKTIHLGSFREWWDAVCARKSGELLHHNKKEL